ncbi:sensor histidine kinase [Virgibacillus soli]|uniref:GHKL domain-containing protein n=1 Tax=Paracerasibacillus soli TaxID=480284 RepID=A0ABU5CVQ8_9BACI|nr:GHKL domain-containing protein [Virgibacillus soli]MDY0409931.1 GHKL domain-containing protein [Virgibacillus soli]
MGGFSEIFPFWGCGLILFALALTIFTYKRLRYPVFILLLTIGLQILWALTAIFTRTPILIGGLFIQLIATTLFVNALRKKHMEKLTKIEADFIAQTTLLHELRQQRHDFHQYFQTLQNDRQLLKDVVQTKYNDTNELIKGESNTLAAFLYTFKEKAESRQIKINYSIQDAFSKLPIPDYDVLSLLSNILINALEASVDYQQLTAKQGEIHISCRKQSGFFIMICKNHSLPLPGTLLDTLYTKKAFSTKGMHHEGLGSQRINYLVEKYHGSLDFSLIDNIFTLKVKIIDLKNNE